jgi:hypothetical protein
MNNNQLAELLTEQRILEPSQIDDALQEANLNGKTLAQTMADNGLLDEHGLYQTIADSLGTEYVGVEQELPPETLRLIRAAWPDSTARSRSA